MRGVEMTTTELIMLLKLVEKGASGRSREISFVIERDGEENISIFEPEIKLNGTGDGVAGAQLELLIKDKKTKFTKEDIIEDKYK